MTMVTVAALAPNSGRVRGGIYFWRKLDCVQEPVAFYRLHGNNEMHKHRSRHSEELECWLRDMGEVEAIRSCPNFHYVQDSLIYLKAMHQILQTDKSGAYRLFRDLPYGPHKLGLLVALVLPASVVRRLRN